MRLDGLGLSSQVDILFVLILFVALDFRREDVERLLLTFLFVVPGLNLHCGQYKSVMVIPYDVSVLTEMFSFDYDVSM